MNDSNAPVALTVRARGTGPVMADAAILGLLRLVLIFLPPCQFRRPGSLAADEVLVFNWHGSASGSADDCMGDYSSDQHVGEDHFAPCPYKELPLLDPVIQMEVSRQGQAFQISLMAGKTGFLCGDRGQL